jgi:hypothetical protein
MLTACSHLCLVILFMIRKNERTTAMENRSSWPKRFRGLARLWSRVGLRHSYKRGLDASWHLAKKRRQNIHSKKLTVHFLIASIVFLLLMAAAIIGILLRVGGGD